MSALRKHLRKHVTRKVSSFPNHRLRLHGRKAANNRSYHSYRHYGDAANDARYHRNRFSLSPLLFHDAHSRHAMRFSSSSVIARDPYLQGLSDVEIPDFIAEGQADRRFFSGPVSTPNGVKARPLARYPVLQTDGVAVAPPSPAVQPAGRHNVHFRFALPPAVAICIRRKQRREIMFALGHAGSRRKQKPPRDTPERKIWC